MMRCTKKNFMEFTILLLVTRILIKAAAKLKMLWFGYVWSDNSMSLRKLSARGKLMEKIKASVYT